MQANLVRTALREISDVNQAQVSRDNDFCSNDGESYPMQPNNWLIADNTTLFRKSVRRRRQINLDCNEISSRTPVQSKGFDGLIRTERRFGIRVDLFAIDVNREV